MRKGRKLTLFLRKICLLVVRRPPFSTIGRPLELVLTLKRAGTTFAAESRASNVITHEATTIKPAKIYFSFNKFYDILRGLSL